MKIRLAQRKAYPSDYLWHEFKAMRYFLLAHVRNEQIMQSVLSEKDAILGNFQESYKHLSYKHLLGLSWSTSR